MKCVMVKLVIGFAGMLLFSSVYAADFVPCQDVTSSPGLAGSLCAMKSLPSSYAELPAPLDIASTDKINLFLRKFPASVQSKGSVWLVSGGPGSLARRCMRW